MATVNPHAVIPVQLPTDQGKMIDAWAILGTTIAFAGQEGERLARDEAARLDEARAALKRKQHIGD